MKMLPGKYEELVLSFIETYQRGCCKILEKFKMVTDLQHKI